MKRAKRRTIRAPQWSRARASFAIDKARSDAWRDWYHREFVRPAWDRIVREFQADEAKRVPDPIDVAGQRATPFPYPKIIIEGNPSK